MANWWGSMTSAQAVDMGMNIFNTMQQQQLLKQQQEAQRQQQEAQNFFKQMQLDLQKQAIDVDKSKLKAMEDVLNIRLKAEKERQTERLGAEKERQMEQLGFQRERLAEESKIARERITTAKVTKEGPNLGEYPSAIKQAMDLYEQTGNWGIVQAVQKQYGMPVEKTAGKVSEMKEAANVWKIAENEDLPLTVDRKLGWGGEEMSLPYDIAKKYGPDAIDALRKMTTGAFSGVLGTDKYSEYSIPQIYEMYFAAKRYKNMGATSKEIKDAMKKANFPDDLINDIFGLVGISNGL